MKLERRKHAETISKKLISEYFITNHWDLNDLYGLITVTGVEISADSSYIDIYVSAIQNQSDLTKTLAKHSHEIHRLLAKKIDFMKVPRVRFRYDESWETLGKISHIISNLNKND